MLHVDLAQLELKVLSADYTEFTQRIIIHNALKGKKVPSKNMHVHSLGGGMWGWEENMCVGVCWHARECACERFCVSACVCLYVHAYFGSNGKDVQ